MRGELLEAHRVYSIVGAFYTVYNYYGYGLSESVYAGALECELIDRGRGATTHHLPARHAVCGRCSPPFRPQGEVLSVH